MKYIVNAFIYWFYRFVVAALLNFLWKYEHLLINQHQKKKLLCQTPSLKHLLVYTFNYCLIATCNYLLHGIISGSSTNYGFTWVAVVLSIVLYNLWFIQFQSIYVCSAKSLPKLSHNPSQKEQVYTVSLCYFVYKDPTWILHEQAFRNIWQQW